MSNELNNIIALNTDGVYEGVAIGGDRYDALNICNFEHVKVTKSMQNLCWAWMSEGFTLFRSR